MDASCLRYRALCLAQVRGCRLSASVSMAFVDEVLRLLLRGEPLAAARPAGRDVRLVAERQASLDARPAGPYVVFRQQAVRLAGARLVRTVLTVGSEPVSALRVA